jgi:Skp family chaperone for outer membrane proteins
MRGPRWSALAVAALGLAGCSAPTHAPHAEEPAIAAVWRARCGACHAPVQPGERSAEALRAAAKRHDKRVHLAAAEWDALIAWLQSD